MLIMAGSFEPIMKIYATLVKTGLVDLSEAEDILGHRLKWYAEEYYAWLYILGPGRIE